MALVVATRTVDFERRSLLMVDFRLVGIGSHIRQQA